MCLPNKASAYEVVPKAIAKAEDTDASPDPSGTCKGSLNDFSFGLILFV